MTDTTTNDGNGDSELIDITGDDGLGAKYNGDDSIEYLRWGKHVFDGRREIVLIYSVREWPFVKSKGDRQLHIDITCYLDYEAPEFVGMLASGGDGETASYSAYHDIDDDGLIDGKKPAAFAEDHFTDRGNRRQDFEEVEADPGRFSPVDNRR